MLCESIYMVFRKTKKLVRSLPENRAGERCIKVFFVSDREVLSPDCGASYVNLHISKFIEHIKKSTLFLVNLKNYI